MRLLPARLRRQVTGAVEHGTNGAATPASAPAPAPSFNWPGDADRPRPHADGAASPADRPGCPTCGSLSPHYVTERSPTWAWCPDPFHDEARYGIEVTTDVAVDPDPDAARKLAARVIGERRWG